MPAGPVLGREPAAPRAGGRGDPAAAAELQRSRFPSRRAPGGAVAAGWGVSKKFGLENQ